MYTDTFYLKKCQSVQLKLNSKKYYKSFKIIKLYHVYSILEIKNSILVVGQPEKKSVLFYDIKNNYNLISSIDGVPLIQGFKKTMISINDDSHLLLSCQSHRNNYLLIVDLNTYMIVSSIYVPYLISSMMTGLNDTDIIFGVMMNKKGINKENENCCGILIQGEISKNLLQLIEISKFEKSKNNDFINDLLLIKDNIDFNQSINDETIKFSENGNSCCLSDDYLSKKFIIFTGKDGKILVLK